LARAAAITRPTGAAAGLIADQGAVRQSQRTIVGKAADDARADLQAAAHAVATAVHGASGPADERHDAHNRLRARQPSTTQVIDATAERPRS
jgi:hypothetical protein